MTEASSGAASRAVRVYRPRGVRASELLRRFLAEQRDERVALGAILDMLGDRAFGALLLLFSLPALVPIPIPGLSSVLGLPLVLLSAQLMLGRPRPWLPARVAAITMPRTAFVRVADATERHLKRTERLLRRRWTRLTDGPAERVLGGICVMLALFLSMPVPFSNMLPALAITLIALGLLEEDGAFTLAGIVAGIASVVVVAGVLGILIKALLTLLQETFG